MSSVFPKKSPQKLSLSIVKGKEIIANFKGGKITSNAGIVFIAELDRRLKITEQFVKCFRDYRHPSYVEYSIHQLLAQRVYSIILGYEDINDHDNLRYDSALAIALQKLDKTGDIENVLAEKSTLNRLEYIRDYNH